MKKTLALIAAAALLTSAGCSGVTMDAGIPESSAGSEESTAQTEAGTEPASVQETETQTSPITTEASASAAVTEKYEISGDGGVIFNVPAEQQDDETLISAGQALFDTACWTEWNYTVGCPYDLDLNQTVSNQYGWDFYLITTPGVNSIADVKRDYHKIFSETYSDALDETFMESGGHVYCLNGARGSDIFYESSIVTAVTAKSANEISFIVENSYNGSDFGGGAHTDKDNFTVAIDSDGIWRVKQFRLPY